MARKTVQMFISGLEGLSFPNVTMLPAKPVAVPDAQDLPVAWVEIPGIMSDRPDTQFSNSPVRRTRFRAALVIPLIYAQWENQREQRDALFSLGQDIHDTLMVADIGFRLWWEIAIDKKIMAGNQTHLGVTAVITGE